MLKDVGEGKFHDLTVQVIKDPLDLGDKMAIWVTDYTENSYFFQFLWGGLGERERDGDPYGYTNKFSTSNTDWPGPFGKRAMQMTCWEPHAGYIRDEVRAGSWVHLRNVQIKFGGNGAHLEGFLRSEAQGGNSKILVDVSNPEEQDREHIDPRLKDAIRRKRDYEKTRKSQIKQIKEIQDKKRTAPDNESTATDARGRRNQKRANKRKKESGEEVKDVNDLNALGTSPTL